MEEFEQIVKKVKFVGLRQQFAMLDENYPPKKIIFTSTPLCIQCNIFLVANPYQLVQGMVVTYGQVFVLKQFFDALLRFFTQHPTFLQGLLVEGSFLNL